MRMLYVFNSVEFFLGQRLHVALAARAKGYEVHVAAPPSPASQCVLDAGLVFHPVPITRQGINPLREIRSLVSLQKLFERVRPDLLELATIKPVLYGGLAARKTTAYPLVNWITGLGYVFSGGGPRRLLFRQLAKAGYRLTLAHPRSVAIFKNSDDRNLFVRAGLVAPERTFLIRGAGVDLTMFRPFPESNPPIALLACRMLWPKGVMEFVRAAREIRQSAIQARFVLVGDTDPGNPEAVPRRQLEAWRREGVVEWWGHRENMASVLRETAVVCLPSYYREGVPKVLLEAAACAKPIVTTDAPGCREVVRDGENGFLVPAHNAPLLVGVLKQLLADPHLRLRMGTRAREIAEEEFSNQRVIAETLRVYDSALSLAAPRIAATPC